MNKAPLSVVIHFPVERHVYKYLQYHVGEKLVVRKKNYFGSIALDMFSVKDRAYKELNNSLSYPVEFSEDFLKRYSIYEGKICNNKFNNLIDQMFRQELMSYIRISVYPKNGSKEGALKDFLFHYNICDEDINYESLLKYINRNAKKQHWKQLPYRI
ncbi:MAG: hypothetical protein ACK4ON_04600 [Bacteroidia bacterium]